MFFAGGGGSKLWATDEIEALKRYVTELEANLVACEADRAARLADDARRLAARLIAEDNTRIEGLVERIYDALVRPGDVCVDGVAGIGRHTLSLGRLVGSTGKVLAFEPQRSNFEQLTRALEAEGIGNVEAHALALSDASEDVRSIPLDRALREVDRLRFVRLDLEGGELDALRGGAEAIKRHRPVI